MVFAAVFVCPLSVYVAVADALLCNVGGREYRCDEKGVRSYSLGR